ncbi:kunitz-type serine protease inhibitor 6-like [Aplochiton taeniatus]
MPQVLLRSILCSLLFAALATAQVNDDECLWDSITDPKQGLDPISLDNGARHLFKGHLPEIISNEGCQKACCENADCQIAMVGMPADGTAECFLVSCLKDGQDVCTLRSDSQFRVFRKDTPPKSTGKIQVAALSDAENTDKAEHNSTDRCSHPKLVGPCRAAFRKYYYDAANQSCQMFIYGGCGANGNNFDTQEECERVCSPVTATPVVADASSDPIAQMRRLFLIQDQDVHPDVPLPQLRADEFAARCEAAPEVGPCRASIRRWHYDSESGSCQSFTYGGCRANQNNYVSEESCLAACKVTVIPKSRKLPVGDLEDEVPKEYREACMVQSDPGPCRAAFPMFFYRHSTGTCQAFIYGGCHGNSNAYTTHEECMSRCGGGAQVHPLSCSLFLSTPLFWF